MPIVTLVVCVLCFIAYCFQVYNHYAFTDAVKAVCSFPSEPEFNQVYLLVDRDSSYDGCVTMLGTLYRSNDRAASVKKIVSENSPRWAQSNPQFADHMTRLINKRYAGFEAISPPMLTYDYAFDPRDWKFINVITANFLHQDAAHLLGNLIIFAVFAAALESIFGAGLTLLALLMLMVGSHGAYALVSQAVGNTEPTIGLSSVALGFVALFCVRYRRAKIECIFWFILIFKRIKLPAWLVGLGFVALNLIVFLLRGQEISINYIGHTSGMIIGIMLGLTLLLLLKPSDKNDVVC